MGCNVQLAGPAILHTGRLLRAYSVPGTNDSVVGKETGSPCCQRLQASGGPASSGDEAQRWGDVTQTAKELGKMSDRGAD